jgi:uncharacterized repeat protein (TIGR03803 family)
VESRRITISLGLATAVVLLFIAARPAACQTETVLYSFKGGSDSGAPAAGLVSDKAGNLYGTTSGFQVGCGTVFELVKPTSSGRPWVENVILAFSCVGTEETPEDALIIDQSGNLYGTTYGNGLGSVFKLAPPTAQGGTWTETVLHAFTGRNGEGGGSAASLVMDKSGNLYGTTEKGGSKCGCGVVFELSPPAVQGANWTESILLSFNGGDSGASPAAGLTLDSSGNLYGTTLYGGSLGFGIIFKLAPPATQGQAWKETNLYNFTSEGDGGWPAANLVLRGDNLYGTAVGSIDGMACQPNCGVIFELSPPSAPGAPWTENTLYAFTGGSDGASPYAPAVFDKAGNLYTTAFFRGQFDYGTVVELSPPTAQGAPWQESVLWSFDGGADGGDPSGGLIFDPLGNLYGTTYDGGRKCGYVYCGTVFRIKP